MVVMIMIVMGRKIEYINQVKFTLGLNESSEIATPFFYFCDYPERHAFLKPPSFPSCVCISSFKSLI